ncbi:MAG: arginine--tRNA ligase [Microgenomates group bacterium]
MVKQKILKNLKFALKKSGVKDFPIKLEHPANQNFGDYATSLAIQLAKKLKKSPLVIAQDIVKNIPKNEIIEKIEVINPGFINFWLSKNFLLSEIKKIIENKIIFPSVYFGKNKKVMVEYAQPNTHKLFHIGHLRNITIGESLARILDAAGNKVIRVNYQGDVGLHIAKCLYQIKNQKLKIKNLKTLKDKIEFLGQAYTQGQKAYEENEKAKEEILKINKMIYEQNPEILPLWRQTRQWSLDYFEKIYKRVDTVFDRLYFESEMAKKAMEICQKLLREGILEKSQGAIVFNGKKYGLDTRVFVNQLGFPTYEGKELALAEKEFSDFGAIDKCIHVVTPEQTSFFKVTFKVEELLNPKKYKGKQYHLAYEWVRLKTGKMSSREGNIIEANWLIDEVKKRIKENFKCKEEIAEVLAVAAVKYSFLKTGIQNSIAFDFNESISLEGNSAPYLLYTYVRAQSVIKKSQISTFKFQNYLLNDKSAIEQEEIHLLKKLYQFPEIIEQSAQNFAPNFIANYLYELAQKFNLFYQKYPILKAPEPTRSLRLAITKATGKVIKQGVYLLGIKMVEKM